MVEDKYKFNTLKVQLLPNTNGVLLVQLNRPKKLNTFNKELMIEYTKCFNEASLDPNVRCVILTSSGKHFTAGIDLSTFSDFPSGETARATLEVRKIVLRSQEVANCVEYCEKPVIMAINGFCIGIGVDLILAGDIRICTKDTSFIVKEVDVGLAADVGTLQRLPKVCSNDSWAREVCLTCRKFDGSEALKFGLVSEVYNDQKSLLEGAIKLATTIASKSPIAVVSTKHLLNHGRDNSVEQGLKYTAAWNAAMLQTEDIPTSIAAIMEKKPPMYSNL